ncbi:MAG: 2,3-dihydroxybiphenyl 1,2-dioxygenase [Neobacillus sp.]|nr:2,3-dihydroxybiphenyl 1,2-dioxygenase [Neobacillus sp.]
MREYLVAPDDRQISGWMSVTPLVHDVAVMSIPNADSSHQLHHFSYWLDNAQDILRAADILSEHGIEFVGPGKHGISQAMYIYVLDPGSGVRLELFSNGYLIFEPDWEPVKWTFDEMAVGFTYWGEQSGTTGKKELLLNAGPVKEKQGI